MTWLVIQLQEPYEGSDFILNPCFKVIGWFENYKDAVACRNDTGHGEHYVIIQAW